MPLTKRISDGRARVSASSFLVQWRKVSGSEMGTTEEELKVFGDVLNFRLREGLQDGVRYVGVMNPVEDGYRTVSVLVFCEKRKSWRNSTARFDDVDGTGYSWQFLETRSKVAPTGGVVEEHWRSQLRQSRAVVGAVILGDAGLLAGNDGGSVAFSRRGSESEQGGRSKRRLSSDASSSFSVPTDDMVLMERGRESKRRMLRLQIDLQEKEVELARSRVEEARVEEARVEPVGEPQQGESSRAVSFDEL